MIVRFLQDELVQDPVTNLSNCFSLKSAYTNKTCVCDIFSGHPDNMDTIKACPFGFCFNHIPLDLTYLYPISQPKTYETGCFWLDKIS